MARGRGGVWARPGGGEGLGRGRGEGKGGGAANPPIVLVVKISLNMITWKYNLSMITVLWPCL